MGMTMAEKILAQASGRTMVRSGDVVMPKPELVILHDGCVEGAWRQLNELGYRRITSPERVMIITDHQVIHTTPASIARATANRRIAREWRVGHFFGAARAGHGHLYPMEVGLVRPGMFLFAYDMHCTNFGAIGAFAQRAGADISVVLGTGSLWTVVPPTLRIDLSGDLAFGVHSRDVGFWLSGALKSGRLGVAFDYRVIEFGGPALASMPLAARVALCNTLTEIGVANVLFSQDACGMPAAAESDYDASYENRLTLNLAQVSPQVALPGAPHEATGIETVAGTLIDHAYVGGCGSGMYEDLATVARVLKGRQVADHVRFFVVPGTVGIATRLAQDGSARIFMEAGAVVLPPGCGPCAGGAGGPLGPGEVSISTAATNGAGRMGASDALCYLGSPETVALSAIAGCITDPRSHTQPSD